MRVGVYLDLRNPPRWQRPWAEHYRRKLRRIREAEALGFDSVWLTEHHFFEDGYLAQPLSLAAAVATQTEQITIGTAVVLAPLHHAVDIAEQAALVDILSNGRLELGLGAGYRVPEFAAYGVGFERRLGVLADRTEEVRRLWEDRVITPPPIQEKAPLWLGVAGPRGARRAGELGAGLLAVRRELLEPYREGLSAAGRPDVQARMANSANLILARDPEAAWPRISQHARYHFESYRQYGAEGSPQESEVFANPLRETDLRSPGPEMYHPRFDVVTPEEAIRRVTEWCTGLPVWELFFWESIAGMPDDLVDEHLELLAHEFAPAVAHLGIATDAR